MRSAGHGGRQLELRQSRKPRVGAVAQRRAHSTTSRKTMTPSPLLVAFLCVVGLGVVALNLWFWFRLVRAEPSFRARIERRYGVVITYGTRGHWKVSGSGSRLLDFALEWLQLAYYMAGFTAWALGLLLVLGVLALLQTLF